MKTKINKILDYNAYIAISRDGIIVMAQYLLETLPRFMHGKLYLSNEECMQRGNEEKETKKMDSSYIFYSIDSNCEVHRKRRRMGSWTIKESKFRG